MTRGEFKTIGRILTNELYISSEELEDWKVVGKCDQREVLQYLEQFRTGRRMGLRMVPEPGECKEWCDERHGYDPYWWAAIQEIKKEAGIT